MTRDFIQGIASGGVLGGIGKGDGKGKSGGDEGKGKGSEADNGGLAINDGHQHSCRSAGVCEEWGSADDILEGVNHLHSDENECDEAVT